MLTLCLIATVGTGIQRDVHVEHVAYIELNHVRTPAGSNLDQIIFYRQYDGEFHVADYCLTYFGWQLPHRSPWILYLPRQGIVKIYFTSKMETWSDYDREVEDQHRLPAKDRKRLKVRIPRIKPPEPVAKT